MNAISKDKPTPQDRWQEKNVKKYVVVLTRSADGQIIEYLEAQSNKSASVRELIRKGFEKQDK